jgi:hypothetical protein
VDALEARLAPLVRRTYCCCHEFLLSYKVQLRSSPVAAQQWQVLCTGLSMHGHEARRELIAPVSKLRSLETADVVCPE